MNTFIHFVSEYWLIFGIFAELGALYWLSHDLLREFYRYQISRYDFQRIDRMSGREFEAFLYKLFRSMGHPTTNLKDTGDFGADLLIRVNGRKTVVQAKRYSKNVSLSAVQEIVAAKAYYESHDAVVVTNSYFTRSAQKLAQVNGVALWDRDALSRMMAEARVRDSGFPLPRILRRFSRA